MRACCAASQPLAQLQDRRQAAAGATADGAVQSIKAAASRQLPAARCDVPRARAAARGRVRAGAPPPAQSPAPPPASSSIVFPCPPPPCRKSARLLSPPALIDPRPRPEFRDAMVSAVQSVVAPHAAHTEERYLEHGEAGRGGTYTPDKCAPRARALPAHVDAPTSAAARCLPPRTRSPSPCNQPTPSHLSTPPSLPNDAKRIVNAVRDLFRARHMQVRRAAARGGRAADSVAALRTARRRAHRAGAVAGGGTQPARSVQRMAYSERQDAYVHSCFVH